MTKRIALFLVPLALALGLVSVAGCAAQTVTDVSAREASSLIQENQKNAAFVVMDVRTPQEFSEGHLAGAVNLNFNDPDFRAQVGTLDKSKTYLVYCRSGNRSSQAVQMMSELGFKDIRHMSGGILEWDANKLPTVKEAPVNYLPQNIGLALLIAN